MADANHTERWLPVVGWEGLYEISDRGRVRSVARTATNKAGQVRHLKSRIRKTSDNGHGYESVSLYGLDEKGSRRYIHDLVLSAFVGPRPDGYQARHLDGDSKRNVIENLAWGTVSENSRDKQRHGTDHYASRDACIHGHEYTPENTRIRWRAEAKDGGNRVRERVCLTCERLHSERRAKSRRENRPPKEPRTECRKGHDIIGDNGRRKVHRFKRKDGSVGETETIECRTCNREHQRRAEAKRKAARQSK